MRIPEAREQQVNIAPRVSAPEVLSPVITNNGAYEAGMEMQRALSNASDGFVKMYVADQRADAIHAFDDYSRQMNELLSSADKGDPKKAALDPKTGLPVGFLQLQGDQINEGNLQLWQQKALNLRTEFNKKISKSIPDIKDEFSRRADKTDEDFNLKTNAHFLKGKYEKAKNAANEDNENIASNTIVGINDKAALQSAYNSMYKNYMTAYQDDKLSKQLANSKMETLIKNNGLRIRREGGPDAYENERAFYNSPSVSKYLSKSSKGSLLHENNLEDIKWQSIRPGMTVAILKEHIDSKIKNLSPLEKETALAAQLKADAKNSESVDEKKVSDFEELVSVLGNGQPNFFMSANKYGINAPEEFTETQNIQYQNAFLTFVDSVFGGLTAANADRIKEEGLSAILPKPQIDNYLNGSQGELMRNTYKKIDSMFKEGKLHTLNSQQSNYLKSIIGDIRKNNYNFGVQARYRKGLESELNTFLQNYHNGKHVSFEDFEKAQGQLLKYMSLFGTEAVKFDENGKYADIVIEMQKAIRDNLVKSAQGQRSLLKSVFTPYRTINFAKKTANFLFGFGDSWKTGLNKADSNRNLKIISDLTELSGVDGKTNDGRRIVEPVIAKEIRNIMWDIQHGDGLTLMPLQEDGTPDPSVMVKRVTFAADKLMSDDNIHNVDVDYTMFEIKRKFAIHLNKKYNTDKYLNMSFDLNDLSAEDYSYLIELTRQQFLSDNGHPNMTVVPSENYSLSYVSTQNGFHDADWSMVGTIGMKRPVNQDVNIENINRFSKDITTKQGKLNYIGSLNASINDLSGADFLGGRATNQQMATLVSEGYTSYEDLSFINGLQNNSYSPDQMVNMALESLLPFGRRGGYLEKAANSLEEMAHSKKEKDEVARIRMIDKEQETLANKIIDRLAEDNPDMKRDDFLIPHTMGYAVSESTLEFVIKEYTKLRSSVNVALRSLYGLNSALAEDIYSFDSAEELDTSDIVARKYGIENMDIIK